VLFVKTTSLNRASIPIPSGCNLRPVKIRREVWFNKILVTLEVTGSSAERAMSRVKIIKSRGGSILGALGARAPFKPEII